VKMTENASFCTLKTLQVASKSKVYRYIQYNTSLG
jgi:hypothetical protein